MLDFTYKLRNSHIPEHLTTFMIRLYANKLIKLESANWISVRPRRSAVERNLKSHVVALGLPCCFIDLGHYGTEAKGLQYVTCGSVFKLMNTAYKVRLHSHDIKYGSGSGQQSVTGSELKEDVNSLWVVKGSPKLACKRGEPIACGSKVQLEHLQTGRNLHSHLFSAPLSGHQEISAFGEDGRGDSGDVWEVVCDDSSWERDTSVQFRHIDTDAYLAASGNTYGRPIHGQMEIVGISRSDSSCYWKTQEGIFVHPTDKTSNSDKHPEHNEL